MPRKSTTTSRKPRRRHLLIYADSDHNADMRYATGFAVPDPFVFVATTAGRKHILVSDLEFDRARRDATVHRVHSLTAYMAKARLRCGSRAGMADVIVTLLRDLSIKSVAVPASFPLGMADQLRKRHIGVTALTDPFFRERVRKRPDEIREIKLAMRATEKGIRAGIDLLSKARISNGYLVHRGRRLTSEIVRTAIDCTVLAGGCEPSATIVAGGRQGCDPHDRGSGLLRANAPIIIDVFPRLARSGYFADITRTVVRGTASQKVLDMFTAVKHAQRAAVAMVRPGVKARDIHAMINDEFLARGFETGVKDGRRQGFFHGTGHGIGLDIHELPRVATTPTPLEAGMVLTIEPGLYYHPHGGVRIEDSVLVTRNGVENLTRLPKVLEI